MEENIENLKKDLSEYQQLVKNAVSEMQKSNLKVISEMKESEIALTEKLNLSFERMTSKIILKLGGILGTAMIAGFGFFYNLFNDTIDFKFEDVRSRFEKIEQDMYIPLSEIPGYNRMMMGSGDNEPQNEPQKNKLKNINNKKTPKKKGK